MRTAIGISVLALTVAFSGRAAGTADDGVVRVLTVGNSFSVDLIKYLPKVARNQGVKLDLMTLYTAGCSLEMHWKNAVSNDVDATYKPYRFMRTCLGQYKDGYINVCDALRLAHWDVVTVQQASHFSWRPETYHPWGDDLVKRIRELVPHAKVMVQETWSYTPWDKRLKSWKIDQDEMYAQLHEAYRSFAAPYGLDVIPFGTAVQEWRKRLPVRYTENSFGGDVVGGRADKKNPTGPSFKRGADGKWVPARDVFHLNDRGAYFQALVWAGAVLGVDAAKVNCRPEGVTEDEAALMKAIAAELTGKQPAR